MCAPRTTGDYLLECALLTNETTPILGPPASKALKSEAGPTPFVYMDSVSPNPVATNYASDLNIPLFGALCPAGTGLMDCFQVSADKYMEANGTAAHCRVRCMPCSGDPRVSVVVQCYTSVPTWRRRLCAHRPPRVCRSYSISAWSAERFPHAAHDRYAHWRAVILQSTPWTLEWNSVRTALFTYCSSSADHYSGSGGMYLVRDAQTVAVQD
jgi:hypothetical protein